MKQWKVWISTWILDLNSTHLSDLPTMAVSAMFHAVSNVWYSLADNSLRANTRVLSPSVAKWVKWLDRFSFALPVFVSPIAFVRAFLVLHSMPCILCLLWHLIFYFNYNIDFGCIHILPLLHGCWFYIILLIQMWLKSTNFVKISDENTCAVRWTKNCTKGTTYET